MKSDSETPASYAVAYTWHLKKGHNELLCRAETDSQALKTYGFHMRQVGGWGDALGVWDGNAIKFGCDECYTPINIIKFMK